MNRDIFIDYEKSNHLRILHPHAEPKFESEEYLLKFIKLKNLNTLHNYYYDLAEDQYSSFDEIGLDGYDLSKYMNKKELNFYKVLTRTTQNDKRKFFALCELKNVYLWNFDFYKSKSFKAITFNITGDSYRLIEGLFVYDRKNCEENLYSSAQLEEILLSNADSEFKITFQALPTHMKINDEIIIRPRMLRIYDIELN